MGYSDGRLYCCSSSSRWCNTCSADNIDLVDELLSHKNDQTKKIFAQCSKYCDIIVYKELSTLVDKCRRYSKLKTDWKDPISVVHFSLGSADTLVRRGGTTNHHSISYSLSIISAKNYQNRLTSVEVIVCNVSVVFLRHSVVYLCGE